MRIYSVRRFQIYCHVVCTLLNERVELIEIIEENKHT